MAIRIGKFFKDFFSTDTAEGAAAAAKATFELAETLNKDEIKKLAPLVEQGGSLLDVLNSPLAELAESTLPFVKVATGLLKFYAKVKQKEPTLAQEVALVSQAAYLESFAAFANRRPKFRDWLKQQGNKPASDLVKRQFRQLDEIELDDKAARIALIRFQDSSLVRVFNQILAARLEELGLPAQVANQAIDRVAQDTHQHLFSALAELGDSAQRVMRWYQLGGADRFGKYLNLEEYQDKEVRSKPNETIFDEAHITFRDLYVPLSVQQLDTNGQLIPESDFVDLEHWVRSMLSDPQEQQQVLFVQGEAGRGKSVFCRMFADRLSRDGTTVFMPIVVRLRHLMVLENTLTRTLENYLQAWDFVTSDPGWLTDKNTRFLFLLDGFDELLLEGRASGGLKEFLQQVEIFQRQSHHRFLITGRLLALQGIDRLITQTECLARVELQPMIDDQQQIWLKKWQQKVGELESDRFWQFLQACPEDVREKLAREPLLLYLLARLHREEQLNVQMFEGTQGIQAKIRIYDESVKWVLEKQRQNENLRLTGLEPEDLRRVLTEAALCVIQSGNEIAKVAMLEARLKDNNRNDRAASLVQRARQETSISDDRTLNNLLTTFYLKPASGDKGGSIEFAHKSFSEFLFAERLKEAIEDWSKPGDKRRGEFYVADKDLHWEIYDLLGYGGLTPEIVEYLMGLLDRDQEVDWIHLFLRLEDFYIRWCDGEFIDADPPTLPQQKMLRMRETEGDRDTQLGQRQVDVYAGLNVMILLLELDRYARNKDELEEMLVFKLYSKIYPGQTHNYKMLEIIGYSHCIHIDAFRHILGAFLNSANLSGANIRGTFLRGANLRGTDFSNSFLRGSFFRNSDLRNADFSNSYLAGVFFQEAQLNSANFKNANLNRANFCGADLENADFSNASLSSIAWNVKTNWEGVKGLEKAVNVPEELKRQLGLVENDE